MVIPNKKADKLTYLKMLLLVIGTISFLVGAAIGSFWYIFGNQNALKKFFSIDNRNNNAAENIYRNPRLELDSLIRAKIFNTSQSK